MNKFAAIACGGLAVAGAYIFLIKPSSTEQLTQSLLNSLPPQATVTLDECNLTLTLESTGDVGAPIAYSRTRSQIDLRNYNFKDAGLTFRKDGWGLRIKRAPVSDLMMAQATKVVEAGRELTRTLSDNSDLLKATLAADRGVLSFQVAATVVETEDGKETLSPHKDAPDFLDFIKAVEALPTPASFSTVASYSPGEQSTATFLTGRINVVPFLEFSLETDEDAGTLFHAFRDYAKDHDCL